MRKNNLLNFIPLVYCLNNKMSVPLWLIFSIKHFACVSIKLFALFGAWQWNGNSCLSGLMTQQKQELRHRMKLEKQSQNLSLFRYIADATSIH